MNSPDTPKGQPPNAELSQPQPPEANKRASRTLLTRRSLVAATLIAIAAILLAVRPFGLGLKSASTLVNSPTATAIAAMSTSAVQSASDSTFTPTYGKNGSFKDWNRLADGMTRFHSHFKWEFDTTYENADGGYKKQGMSLQRFLREAEQVSHHLDMHHRIEEAYIFPLLASKMPAFRDGAREKGEHIIAHRGIHDGLTKYDAYLSEVKANPSVYDAAKLREIMDSFREVLFTHLESEVHDLGAESMQKHGFTLAELKRFPM